MSLAQIVAETPVPGRLIRVKYSANSTLKNKVSVTKEYLAFSVKLIDSNGVENTFLFTPAELFSASERGREYADKVDQETAQIFTLEPGHFESLQGKTTPLKVTVNNRTYNVPGAITDSVLVWMCEPHIDEDPLCSTVQYSKDLYKFKRYVFEEARKRAALRSGIVKSEITLKQRLVGWISKLLLIG